MRAATIIGLGLLTISAAASVVTVLNYYEHHNCKQCGGFHFGIH